MRLMVITIFLVSVATLTCEKVSACFHRHPRCCRQGCIPSAVESAPQPLTADSARQALIGMLARGDGPRFDTRDRELTALKNGQPLLILEKRAEGIVSGGWNCDLDGKRFSFICPIGSCDFSCNGDFEYVNGQWDARIRGWMWAYFGPDGKQ